MIRLDKLLSGSLPCTRKDAAGLIRSGRVAVDGTVIRKPDTKLEENAELTVDGAPINARRFIYIMMNKPAGLISATDDVREKTVLSLLPDEYLTKNIFPAGRLDKDTTGLLILTNDGEVANKLMHPKNHVEKIYHVKIKTEIAPEKLAALNEPMVIDDYKIKPVKVTILERKEGYTILKFVLSEGRNRQIRKMCENTGLKVRTLTRVAIGGIKLGDLPFGSWRELSKKEILLLGGHPSGKDNVT